MTLLLKSFLPVSLLSWLSIRYVDRPVALFVRDYLYGNRQWALLTSSLPDLLLLVVVIVSVGSFIGYCYRQKRLLLDNQTRLLGQVALSLPVSYGVRAVLKIVFGRVVTRVWVNTPHLLQEFHWFHGGAGYNGFPSGHMVVFATLFAAIARYQPGYRFACYALLGLLALLLVATNYHFVADVICGTYVGLLIEACMEKVRPRRGGADNFTSGVDKIRA